MQDKERRSRKRKTSERENLDIITIVKKNRTKTLAKNPEHHVRTSVPIKTRSRQFEVGLAFWTALFSL